MSIALIILSALLLLAAAVFLFIRQPSFGRLPSGARLARIRASPDYKGGAFQNQSFTPMFTEGANFFTVLKDFAFGKKERIKPDRPLPSVKTDLGNLDPAEDVLVWFGHSSYFMQLDGKRFLVDPVFSGSASPLPFGVKAFPGTDAYSAADMPAIDFLIISHDHWDHLDYKTILQLKPKTGKVICGLGVGEHFERWGFAGDRIVEKDWNETIDLGGGFAVHTAPARHFSGRGPKRNQSMWLSFVLRTPTMQLYLGGDSGFDGHFEAIGKQFGGFDLAILENGQYSRHWKHIHMLPSEFPEAARLLHAKKILPVHCAKFALSNHPWDEPLELVFRHNEQDPIGLVTPKIGEPVRIKDPEQVFGPWWK